MLPRCHSDALHHCHRLHKDVSALLPVPAQVQNRVPAQLHHDHAVCWTHEVGPRPLGVFICRSTSEHPLLEPVL